jgi:DNA mismatch repair protein MSH6
MKMMTQWLLIVTQLLCSTGRFNVGAANLDQIDVLLRTHRPHEVVHPRGRLPKALKSWLRQSTSVAVWSSLTPGHKDDEFWPADVTRVRLPELLDADAGHTQGKDRPTLPRVLADLMRDDSDASNLALNALGGAIAYLKKLNLERDLLSLRNFHDLQVIFRYSEKRYEKSRECVLMFTRLLCRRSGKRARNACSSMCR